MPQGGARKRAGDPVRERVQLLVPPHLHGSLGRCVLPANAGDLRRVGVRPLPFVQEHTTRQVQAVRWCACAVVRDKSKLLAGLTERRLDFTIISGSHRELYGGKFLNIFDFVAFKPAVLVEGPRFSVGGYDRDRPLLGRLSTVSNGDRVLVFKAGRLTLYVEPHYLRLHSVDVESALLLLCA